MQVGQQVVVRIPEMQQYVPGVTFARDTQIGNVYLDARVVSHDNVGVCLQVTRRPEDNGLFQAHYPQILREIGTSGGVIVIDTTVLIFALVKDVFEHGLYRPGSRGGRDWVERTKQLESEGV